jgi:hypothetical protein
VAGLSMARLADALSSASRVGVEVPRLQAGASYSEITRRVSTVARPTRALGSDWGDLSATSRTGVVSAMVNRPRPRGRHGRAVGGVRGPGGQHRARHKYLGG